MPGRAPAGFRHTDFTFRVGRAGLRNLPILGRRLADRYGCEIVAAFLNIGAAPDSESERVWRPFLFVGRREGCRFDVQRRTWSERFILPRKLSMQDPDLPWDLSDFAGPAQLDETGLLGVAPIAVATPYLPSHFQAAPTRAAALTSAVPEGVDGADRRDALRRGA